MNSPMPVLDPHQFPDAIVNHALSGVLELRWHDGTTSQLSHASLRAGCRCASCQQQARSHGDLQAHRRTDEGIRLQAIHPVADRGLNLVFSDGHGRGIFPWSYLHELSLQESIPQPSIAQSPGARP